VVSSTILLLYPVETLSKKDKLQAVSLVHVGTPMTLLKFLGPSRVQVISKDPCYFLMLATL